MSTLNVNSIQTAGGASPVLVNDIAKKSDLVASSGASLVGYTPAGIGAVATTVQSKLRESVSFADYGGSPTNTAAVNTAALQKAADYAASIGATLRMAEGTYLFDPTTTVSALGVAKYCAVVMQSNLHIEGVGKVTLKIRDGFSTTGSPKDYFLFLSTTNDTDISFTNLTFDMNGHNNLIAVKPVVPAPPTAPGADWGTLLTSAIAWLSDNATPTAGKIDGLLIENCTFTGTPGTNNLVLGTGVGSPFPTNLLSNNTVIRSCIFTDSGFNTSDYTAIYGYAERMLVERCKFVVAASRDNPMTGIAVEVHGAFSTVRGCKVFGLSMGVLVCDNYVAAVYDVSVYGNYIEVFTCPVGFFRISNIAVPTSLYGIVICDNLIKLIAGVSLNNLAYGIGFYTVDRTISDVQIFNNSITNCKGNAVDVIGVYCGSSNPLEATIADKVYIKNNQIYDFTTGVELFIGLDGSDFGEVYICDNTISNIVTTTIGGNGRGIFVYDISTIPSVFGRLDISNNVVESQDLCIYLNGTTVTVYNNFGNTLLTSAANAYFEQSVTIATRYGFKSAISYGSAAPTAGTWRIGDIVYNTAPTSGGYIGWVCAVAGTPGTWKTFGAISA